MKILTVDPAHPDPAPIQEAAETLRRGGLVAFPTETVYGLGANALDVEAISAIYRAKGRPAVNPLIAHVADIDSARAIVTEWPATASRLAEAFWPGPLTLVLPKREIVPDAATAGLGSVAVRVPANPIAQSLLRAAGFPIVAPSANRYTELSPTRAEHVARGLGDAVDLILDSGQTTVGIESTVVDLTSPVPVLLRPGTLSRERIEEVLGTRLGNPADYDESAPRPSPGLSRRHYAPRALLRVVRAPDIESALQRESGRVAVLAITAPGDPAADASTVRMPADPAEYAVRLYDSLHRLDAERYDVVLAEAPPGGSEWDGIRDRLHRAASGHDSA